MHRHLLPMTGHWLQLCEGERRTASASEQQGDREGGVRVSNSSNNNKKKKNRTLGDYRYCY